MHMQMLLTYACACACNQGLALCDALVGAKLLPRGFGVPTITTHSLLADDGKHYKGNVRMQAMCICKHGGSNY